MQQVRQLGNLVIIFSLMLIIIAGCKKDDPVSPTDSLVGTWKLTYITAKVGGATLPMTPEQAGTQMTIVIKSDGTYTATIVRAAGTETDTGTFTATGTSFTMKSTGGTITTNDYSLSGNKLLVKGYKLTDPTFGEVEADLEFTKQ